jgi:hypothetical protein
LTIHRFFSRRGPLLFTVLFVLSGIVFFIFAVLELIFPDTHLREIILFTGLAFGFLFHIL